MCQTIQRLKPFAPPSFLLDTVSGLRKLEQNLTKLDLKEYIEMSVLFINMTVNISTTIWVPEDVSNIKRMAGKEKSKLYACFDVFALMLSAYLTLKADITVLTLRQVLCAVHGKG